MSEITRGSTTFIRVITKATGPEGRLVGFADNFRCGKTHRAENVSAIGSFLPVEALFHGEEGHFSWGQAHTFGRNEFTELGITPKKVDFASFSPFVVRVHDDASGKVLAHILDGLPTSSDLTVNAQQRLMSNVSGICRLVQFAGELN